MLNFKKISIVLLITLFCFPAFAQKQTSQILSIKAEEKNLIIEVAKAYPQVKFSIYKEEGRILIDLLDTKYHESFKYDIPTKLAILTGLEFVDEVSVGEAKSTDETYKVGIWLTLKEGVDVLPHVLTKQNNSVTISFPERIKEEPVKEFDESNEEPEESETIDVEEEQREEVAKSEFVSMSVIDLYNQATDEYSKGNHQKAEELYKQVLLRDKNFFLAKFNLANIYLDQDRFAESEGLLSQLSEKFEYFIKADQKNLLIVKNTLGILYYSNGELEKALDEFNAIVAINPEVHEPYYNIGLIYEKMEKVKEAKASFEKAINYKEDFTDAYYHLGVLNSLTKDKKDAIKNFEKVIELDPYGKLGKLSKEELKKISKKHKK